MMLYPCKLFKCYIRKFFPREYLDPNFSESSCHLRKRLCSVAKFNLIFFATAMVSIWYLWRFDFSLVNTIIATSAYIALTATVGRGGLSLQTWDGRSLSEKID